MPNSGHAPNRIDFLKGLRQARHFLDTPVPQAIVDELLAVARDVREGVVPAPWRFQVIDELATKKALSVAGVFTEFLAHVAVAIVVVGDGFATPSKANVEGRIAERIMLAARRHGLGGGAGWFSTDEAQDQAKAILGLPVTSQVLVIVGVGYVEESSPDETPSLQRVRKSLDALSGKRRQGRRQ